MKKVLFIVSVLMVFFLMVSCSNSQNTSSLTSSDENKQQSQESKTEGLNKRNIALVMKTLTNPFFKTMEKGARKAEKDFDINLIVKTATKETSIEQQISIVEELISSKVDAIAIAPGSSTDLIPVLKKAQDAGIKIVNIDNRLDKEASKKAGLKDVPFISVDNEAGAYLSAKEAIKNVKTLTEAVILEGIRSADNAEQRRRGAVRAFSENKNIKLIASETANWKIDEAKELFGKILNKNPKIKVVFCANDMMALGVVQYLDSYNIKNIRVAGFDALDEAKKAIKSGKMVVTIDQQADQQGYEGVKFAMDMLDGKTVPMEKYVDAKVVRR